jgi:hypothetical protein
MAADKRLLDRAGEFDQAHALVSRKLCKDFTGDAERRASEVILLDRFGQS